jgi:hypothetical protein
MRWKQFANDIPKAQTLGDILMGAARAGGVLTEIKLAVVHGQVAKSLGATQIPPDLLRHMEQFEPLRFNLEAACKSLELDGTRGGLDLMKAVSAVITAETIVLAEERAYALRVASELGLPWTEVLNLVGMPSRPTTGPRPRPSPRH